MLNALREWLVSWADSPAGPAVLALIAAAEAVVFPLPVDPLLIALALQNPSSALLLAGLATVASVAGGLVGHWLGLRFGRPLLERLHGRYVDRVEALFQRYGFWAVLLGGFTPLPYKVFTVSAGVFAVPRLPFIVASVIGRGLRFFSVSWLILLWGDRFEEFLDERFDLVMYAAGGLLVIGVAVWAVWMWRNGRRRAESGAT